MDILARIEIKLDALMKCWSIQQGDKERTLFEVVDELIKEQDKKETHSKSVLDYYKESKEKEDYETSLEILLERLYTEKKVPVVDADGFFFDDAGRVFNMKDRQ